MDVVSRRRFLKISGATLGAAAAAGGHPGAGLRRRRGRSRRPRDPRTVPTFCDICFWKCGAIATVRDGRLWKIEGNPDDPLSRGRLCPRGTGGVGAHFDPDRLQTPLIRRKNRGEDEWAVVTWDEALGYVAEKLQTIKAAHGPEAVALFSHGIGGNFLKHTLKAFGTPNIAAAVLRAVPRPARRRASSLTFGEDVGSPERTDIRNARCLVLLGSHLGENMHNTQVQEFAEADRARRDAHRRRPALLDRGRQGEALPAHPAGHRPRAAARVDARASSPSSCYDREYVAQYGFGFDAFAASIAGYTPEWAYPETGIEPDVIRETAREMARHRPATLVHPGRHATWYGDDAQRSRAIALLNALLGSWGARAGSTRRSAWTCPRIPIRRTRPRRAGKVDNPGKKYPFAIETITTGIRDATITGRPYPVKGWFVYATNLLQALPNEAETIEAIQKLDLLVVVDVVPSEIAGWADVVLPEATYLERHDDLNVEWFREPFVALRQPVVDAPHDQKPNWWIARELALKLGLGAYYPWTTIEEYLETRLTKAGLSLRRR